ncbi:hypothetical protein PJV94_00280 [Aliarcobacter butzleri]|uniref:hypothetical protein n=1 Tax=Aliarcobacter butzleri TaxID=28197 RepID=UPI00263DA4AC|nr:hypothetical protein [Aliarcobacter butzleri]MDN5072007.1 hypothetical protein [Aliarcobacter butzleri]MDN5120113.1 hypothetical protein [Aliarcobacter butzleri]MDN5130531.1 hypothetical protein [Aliarcobacter butzleri]
MYKKIFISLLFITAVFNGCSSKNNISKKESYKVLDEVAVVGQKGRENETVVEYNGGFSNSGICKKQSKNYFDELTNIDKLVELLKAKNVKITTIEKPIKKLLVVKPIDYESMNFSNECLPSRIFVEIILYDMQEVSKNWTTGNKINFKSLDDKNIIYRYRFYLDSFYNSYSELDTFAVGIAYRLNQDSNRDKKDVEKFYKEVIKDLEKVMKFPQ